jgi:hypothetical protein
MSGSDRCLLLCTTRIPKGAQLNFAVARGGKIIRIGWVAIGKGFESRRPKVGQRRLSQPQKTAESIYRQTDNGVGRLG